MNWDWDKLQEKRERQSGYSPRPSGQEGKPSGTPPGLPQFKGANSMAIAMGALFIVFFLVYQSAYKIDTAEKGVVRRFGAFDSIMEEGLNFRLPFIYTVEKVNVNIVRRVEVGFTSSSTSSRLASSRQRESRVQEESLMLTGDENIVDLQFVVNYQVSNAEHYLFRITDPEGTVKSAAEAAMREIIGENNIDVVLTSGKDQIKQDTMELLQDILDRYESGIYVVNVELQEVHAPDEVMEAFKDVVSAREDMNRYINEAQAYRNDLLPKTRGEAAKILREAEAYKESLVLRARGEAERFRALLEAYNTAPEVTRERLFLEAMETIYSSPNLHKIIIADDAAQSMVPYLPLDRLMERPPADKPEQSMQTAPDAPGGQ